MSSPIRLADGIILPANAATQRFAFLGRTGSGKSYAAGVLVEGLLSARSQVVVLDGMGIWYGLRLRRDGKGASGFDIPVFGGLHGDVSLSPTSGALIADLIVDRGISAVLDVLMFKKGERKRFVTDFAERLFDRKKDSRSPMHLVLEEAQMYVPQKMQPDEARMLGAFEDIAQRGRVFGIGVSLITQRPQAVEKSVLNQTEVLVALQLSGSHERKAIDAWVADNASDADEDAINLIDRLPHLPVGGALVWSPQWIKTCCLTKIGKKATYDAGRTPDGDTKGREPKPLDSKDLDALKTAMLTVEREASENDPKKLRERIRELEAAASKQSATPSLAFKLDKQIDALKKQHDEMWAQREESDAERLRLGRACASMWKKIEALAEEMRGVLAGNLNYAQKNIGRSESSQVNAQSWERSSALVHAEARAKQKNGLNGRVAEKAAASLSPAQKERMRDALDHADAVRHAVREGEAKGLRKGERTMLDVLAKVRPNGLTRAQLARLAGLAPTSGTFSTYLGTLKTQVLVETEGDKLFCTATGYEVAGSPEPQRMTGDALKALWMPKFRAGERRMLETLIAAPRTRSELAEAVEMSASSGTFSTYLGSLKSAGLVTDEGGQLCAAPEFDA